MNKLLVNKRSRLIGVAVLLAVSTTPAAAEYYIIRETAVGPCKIVDSRPAEPKTIVGGDGRPVGYDAGEDRASE